ncbi:MAG: hypothetical protein E7057_10885 [Lentisphaerae bacterium]|nr:hypothetical protein [Lentisphaerota bacterium]
MSESASAGKMSVKEMVSRFLILLAAAGLVGFGGAATGAMTTAQSTACAVFISIIFGTLFFWGFRLAIAFLGLAVLIFNKSMDIPTFVNSSSLEVIMFLVGMMIIVGALRDLGFFTWIVQLIVSMPRLNGKKFIFVTATASALLACAVDEVTSIIFISTLIFQVCDRLKLNATPYILIAVLATNIGSAGTMMGNPVGIFIGTKGQLTFGDFMVWAFPLMLVSLFATIGLLLWFFRKDLAKFDVSLKERLARGLSIAPVVKVPYMRGLILIVLTVVAIASHHQTEELLGLDKNSVLLVMPLICAGVVMILKPDRARHYVEKEVDWWTLIFFMLLFAVAGTLEHTHVDQVLANGFSKIAGSSTTTLVPFIFTVSAFGSAFVDNVIFVAAFSPVIEQLSINIKDLPLWWALLFGACFGGNITMIGSTANIVALGMLEKHGGSQISFFQWFKIGLLCTALSGALAIGALLFMAPHMPDHKITFEKLAAESGYVPATEVFDGELTGVIEKEDGKLYLANGKGAKVMIELGDGMAAVTGKVRVNGSFSKDEANAAYPYKLTVKKLTELKEKE